MSVGGEVGEKGGKLLLAEELLIILLSLSPSPPNGVQLLIGNSPSLLEVVSSAHCWEYSWTCSAEAHRWA